MFKLFSLMILLIVATVANSATTTTLPSSFVYFNIPSTSQNQSTSVGSLNTAIAAIPKGNVDARLSFNRFVSSDNPYVSELTGHFITEQSIDFATFSALTPWYISVNGKKIYSGTLEGNQSNFHLNNDGSEVVKLKSNEGYVTIKWYKAGLIGDGEKTISFTFRGTLPTLASKMSSVSHVVFALGGTFVSFDGTEKSTANLVQRTKNVDLNLTRNQIEVRNRLFSEDVQPRIRMQIGLLDDLNDSTLTTNRYLQEVTERLELVLNFANIFTTGIDLTDKGKVLFNKTIFKTADSYRKEMAKEFAKQFVGKFVGRAIEGAICEENCPFASDKFADNFVSLVVEYALTSKKELHDKAKIGVLKALEISLKSYTISRDFFSAYLLNKRTDAIYENQIAEKVIKQYIQDTNAVPPVPVKNWKSYIETEAKKMNCVAGKQCREGLPIINSDNNMGTDYYAENVNNLVQEYLATMRVMGGYGEFYLHNGK